MICEEEKWGPGFQDPNILQVWTESPFLFDNVKETILGINWTGTGITCLTRTLINEEEEEEKEEKNYSGFLTSINFERFRSRNYIYRVCVYV